jgi:hypothetical protein
MGQAFAEKGSQSDLEDKKGTSPDRFIDPGIFFARQGGVMEELKYPGEALIFHDPGLARE